MELHPKIKFELEHIDFDPEVVFEIGVGPSKYSRSRFFWETAECHLFEPMRRYSLELRKAVENFPKVHLHEVAIWKESGEVTLVENDLASYVEGVDSPNEQWERSRKRPRRFFEHRHLNGIEFTTESYRRRCVQVSAKPIDVYDQGNIDVLWLDMEGAEYCVFEKLVSRPRFISVECKAAYYTNPHLQEIKGWMDKEGYMEAGSCDMDVYFVKTR